MSTLGPEGQQAMIDQGVAALRDMGRMVSAFWKGLVIDGLPPEAATLITAAYVNATINNLPKPPS